MGLRQCRGAPFNVNPYATTTYDIIEKTLDNHQKCCIIPIETKGKMKMPINDEQQVKPCPNCGQDEYLEVLKMLGECKDCKREENEYDYNERINQ